MQRMVFQTKSVEFMPFNLSLFAFLCSVFWLAYGALSKDIVVMVGVTIIKEETAIHVMEYEFSFMHTIDLHVNA